MKLILCDQDASVLGARRSQFNKRPEVEIREGDLLETQADALLVPGNSFGFLDSAVELRISSAYGWEVQDALRDHIAREYHGELLVGQAFVLRLPAASQGLAKTLLYAPVWRTPRRLEGSANVFLAVRAGLRAVAQDGGTPSIDSVAVPAMGLEGGELNPYTSARQLRYAYEIVLGQRKEGGKNLSQQIRRERKMTSIPRLDADTPAEGS